MFKSDSLVGRFLSGLTDQLVLDLLFLVTCLPVFTAGAAAAALYTAQFAIAEGRSAGVFRDFVRGFRENFPRATGLFLAAAAMGAVIAAALWAAALQGLLRTAPGLVVAAVVLAVYLGMVSWLFPLLARFEQSAGKQLYNAYALAVAKLPVTLALLAVNFWWVPAFFGLHPSLFGLYLFVLLFCQWAAASWAGSRIVLAALGQRPRRKDGGEPDAGEGS